MIPKVPSEDSDGSQIIAQAGIKPGTIQKSEPLVKRPIQELNLDLKPVVINIATQPSPAAKDTLNPKIALEASVSSADKRVLDLPSSVRVGNESMPSRIVLIENTTLQMVTEKGGVLSVQATDGVKPIPVDVTGRVQMVRSNSVETEGAGLKPNSEFAVYLFSEPILLGIGKTDSLGNFYASFLVEDKIPLGQHTLQVRGVLATGTSSTISMPVAVVESNEVAAINAMSANQLVEETYVLGLPYLLFWSLLILTALLVAVLWVIFIAKRRKQNKNR